MRDRYGPFGRFEIIIKSEGFLKVFLSFPDESSCVGRSKGAPWGRPKGVPLPRPKGVPLGRPKGVALGEAKGVPLGKPCRGAGHGAAVGGGHKPKTVNVQRKQIENPDF